MCQLTRRLLPVAFCAAACLPPAGAGSAWADVILLGANKEAQVTEVNVTRQTYRVIGSLGEGTAGAARDPLTGYFYYFEKSIEGSDGDTFNYWDPATGLRTIVRRYDPPPGMYIKRMAFAPDNTLYMSDDRDILYTIDKHTGAFTELGFVSGMEGVAPRIGGDMAFTPDGSLYVVNGAALFYVDLETLTATLLYPELIPASDGGGFTGMGHCDGLLYGAGMLLSDPPDPGSLYETGVWSIDPATGAAVQIQKLWPPDPYVGINDLGSCMPRGSSDVTPPAVTITSPTSSPSYSTAAATLSLGGTASDDTAVASTTWANSRGGSGTASGTGSWTVDAIALQSGDNEITVTATDTAGNTATDRLTATYSASNEPPLATITSPLDGAQYAVGQTLQYAGTGTDAEDGTLPPSSFTWEAARTSGEFHLLAQGVTGGSATLRAPGSYLIRLTVRDAGGLADSDEVTITIQ